MQYKFFVVHGCDSGEEVEELNRFLRSVRILSVAKEFVETGGCGSWNFCIEYLDRARDEANGDDPGRKKKGIDYQKVLPPEDFALFATLRTWRKEQAAQENIPVYAIFTNDQLAKMAGNRVASIGELQEIDGVGEAKVSKYGKSVIEIVAGNEKNQ